MNSSQSSSRQSPGRRPGAHLAALAASIVLGLGVGAVAQDKPHKPKAPLFPSTDCAQDCFDDYLDNVERCKSIFCTSFLFITFCDEANLATCIDNANDVFETCIAGCQDPQV